MLWIRIQMRVKLKGSIWIRIKVSEQNPDPAPHQRDAAPKHCLTPGLGILRTGNNLQARRHSEASDYYRKMKS
jgi:hypothetical protein